MANQTSKIPALVEEGADAAADSQFIDDLLAAQRLKTFLIGGGIEVPRQTSEGIAKLGSIFQEDLDRALANHNEKNQIRKSWFSFLTRLPFFSR